MTDITHKVYLAAPLFSQVERQWNRLLANELEGKCRGVSVILPQDFKVSGSYNDERHFGEIFEMCDQGVRGCDAMVAVLDGVDADSGTSFEVGMAYALGIPVVGVRSDFRDNQEKGLNIMLSRGCTVLVREYAFNEDLELLATSVARRLKKVLPVKGS